MDSITYNPHTCKWHFPHQRNLGFRLFPLTEPESVVRRSIVLADVPAPACSKRWRSRYLTRNAPEMGPAMEWIDNYLEESQLVIANANISDPVIGRLLAFGWATNPRFKNRSPAQLKVAAFASGQTGSDLVLVRMRNEERILKGSDNVRLLTPQIVSGSESRYHFQSPIRQVCFARNPYRAFLAVRLSGFTRIYSVQGETRGTSNQFLLKNFVTHRPLNSHGTADHADVTFNPWQFKQFGTIDQQGNWQVCDISGYCGAPRKDSGLSPKHIASGQLVSDSESSGNGWGKISWGGDLNTIMTCDRHIGALFDIRTSTAAPSITLPADHGRSWILDLQRASEITNCHDAFVLTSSYITQVDVRQPGRALLSWPHGRHRDDISMYLDLFRSGDVTTAVIGSRMTFLTTCHQFSSPDKPATRGDPFPLSPPFTHSDPYQSASSMTILPCSLRSTTDADNPAIERNDQEVNFFVGFSIDKGLGISRRIYATQDGSNNGLQLVPKPSSAFINDSDNEADVRPSPISAESRQRANFAELYDDVFQGGVPGSEVGSIKGYCTRLNEILMGRVERGNLGVSSLIDVHAPSSLFDKLSDLESGIETLLCSGQVQDTHETKSLISRSVPASLLASNDSESSGFSIQTLYNNLINTRVAPLPESIPGRVRLRRERLCRHIAAEVFLASTGINVRPTPEQLIPPQVSEFPPITPPDSPDSPELPKEEPLQRIRAYAYVQTRINLPQNLANVLDSWKVGEDPSEFEFFIDPEEGMPRYRKDRRKIRKEKQRLGKDGLVDIFGGSQPPALRDGVSSQNQGGITMSQVEKGKHGGRKQKKRRTGF